MSSAHQQSPLWQPSPQDLKRAEMARFMSWAGQRRGRPFADYDELWRWSVDQLEDFWAAIWEFFGVRASRGYEQVLASRDMPGASWFAGAELNYAENMLAGVGSAGARDPQAVAVLHTSELRALDDLRWGELSAQVAAAAQGLRSLGVGRGDRVVAYLPNIPETLIAFLATASIGAIWSSAAPEFGARSVIDRFAQIEPKVLVAVDGYRHGGKDFDRTTVVHSIVEELASVEHVVVVPYLHPASASGVADAPGPDGQDAPLASAPSAAGARSRLTWEELLARGAPSFTSSRSRSPIRCGCSTHPAPPGFPRRSCRATAGSCWSS
jgi:acetoacetyl-CoA synthetase